MGGGAQGEPRRGEASVLAALERLISRLAVGAEIIAAILVLVMAGVVAYSVALRYFFGQPQVWSDELIGYLLVAATMLGAAEALRRDEHIGVDLLIARLGLRGRRLAEMWGLAAVIFVSLVLVVGGHEMVAFSAQVDLFSEGYLEVPMWIPQLVIPLGAGLLGLMALSKLLRRLSEWGTATDEEAP